MSTPILRDPTPLTHADHIVVESTYGNREHAPHDQAIDELVAAIGEVADDEGVLLMPAFAIGRTQEVIWVLDDLVRDGRIPRIPLYLDSPMASRATRVYDEHPETYDEETGALLRSGDSPLRYPGQQFTDTVEESKAIRFANRPIMVVASSGMLTGGRIMHHLKDFLPDPACTLLFIGYQGEGTLGRHIQDGAKKARIDGEELDVRCRVRSISGFSAHADQHELEAWLGHFSRAAAGAAPKTVFIVHGDPDAAEAFAARIRIRARPRGPRRQAPRDRDIGLMAPRDRPIITFLTDFGFDGAAATCRGVMLSICRDAEIVDVSHAIGKFAVADGAFVLRAALPFMPVGVHVAVVDPGVGTARRPIALRAGRGDVLVGPDNGLLVPAAEALGGIAEARELTEGSAWLPTISSTFHGRDIFSPVAAHLANGDVRFEDVGPLISADGLVRLPATVATARPGRIEHGRHLRRQLRQPAARGRATGTHHGLRRRR